MCNRELGREAFCRCGYEPATGDVRSVAIKARRRRERAGREMLTGFALLAILPITVFIAMPVIGVTKALWLVAAPQLVAGVGFTLAGAYKRIASQRLLDRASTPALPSARVIE